ncbi:hypothetical protein LTR22_019452 [Elasticomyces elasticus]|nr:hypothetical protein LTR22_019452 [Elasticomyces elasticus]KAK4925721.1 hypothetical protein LTR49_007331 [Elasticomyces elasticus]KAK5765053.1 hypothetical protein LTS12_004831 [Elasticomyces elasticus]
MAARKRKTDVDGDNKAKVPYKSIRHKVKATLTFKQKKRYASTSTSSMTRAAPCHAVFATAELLENILVHAPVKTIFGVQRVCRQFRDIVKTSIILQDKMFLRPPTTAEAVEVWGILKDADGTWVDEVVRINNMHDLPHNVRRLWDHEADVRQAMSHPNPLLEIDVAHGQDLKSQLLLRMFYGESFHLNVRNEELRDCSSWRNTYMATLPWEKYRVILRWEILVRPALQGTIVVPVPDPDLATGHTLGSLVDAAMRSVSPTYSKHDESPGNGRPLHELVDRLERETGKGAILRDLTITGGTVIAPTSQDRALVRDA